MIKKYGVYAILICGWILFLTLWINEKLENEDYERFLSNVIAEKIGTITTVSPYSIAIIDEILENKYITREQVGDLSIRLLELDREVRDISNLAVQLGKLKFKVQNIPRVIHAHNGYLINLTPLLDDNQQTPLTAEQVEEFEKIRQLFQAYYQANKVNLKFTSAIGEDSYSVGFYNYYANLGISDDYWINILKEYENVSILSN